MERKTLIFYIVIGIGLIFSLPAVESVDAGLGGIMSFLVIGYWGGMGVCFLLILLKKLIAEYRIGFMIYHLWLFLSLMSVAVGTLAILDDGLYQVPWAAALIFYGTVVGYLNRKEL